MPNLQLHGIMPLSFVLSTDGITTYGYGDTDVGTTYRLVQESATRPMIGTFPLA